MSVLIFWPAGGTPAPAPGEGYEDDVTGPQESGPALTASAAVLVDQWGDVRFSDIEDPEQSDPWGEAVSVGPAIQTLLTSGLANADFSQGPPDPGQPIGDSNPLPGWRWSATGGDLAWWVQDADSPSGYAVEVTHDATVPGTSDLSQIFALGQDALCFIVRAATEAPSTSPSGITTTLEVQELSSIGAWTATYSSGVSWDQTEQGTITTAYYTDPQTKYLRVGWKHSGSTGTAGPHTRRLFGVTARTQPTYATWTAADTSLPATGTSAIYTGVGSAGVAAQRYIAPADGWVVAISVRLSDERTSGILTFEVRNETDSLTIGPIARINGTDTQAAYAVTRAPANAFFTAGDRLRIVATVTSGTFAPTTADAVVHVTAALLV